LRTGYSLGGGTILGIPGNEILIAASPYLANQEEQLAGGRNPERFIQHLHRPNRCAGSGRNLRIEFHNPRAGRGDRGKTGIGFSYTDASAAHVISKVLAEQIAGRDALAIPVSRQAMLRRVRNIGRPGLAATAISAVDFALWDLKGKLLGLPTVCLHVTARCCSHLWQRRIHVHNPPMLRVPHPPLQETSNELIVPQCYWRSRWNRPARVRPTLHQRLEMQHFQHIDRKAAPVPRVRAEAPGSP
jgi:hypothetical protein